MGLTQQQIDEARARVLLQLLRNDNKEFPKIMHLWFPRDSDRAYELRTGNPPADQDRPKHLFGKKLHIDLQLIDSKTRQFFEKGGEFDNLLGLQIQQAGHKPSAAVYGALCTRLFRDISKRMFIDGSTFAFR